MKKLTTAMAIVAYSTVLLILLFLIYFSAPLLQLKSLLELMSTAWNPPDSYGIGSMVVSSLIVAIIATILGAFLALFSILALEFLPNRVADIYIGFISFISAIPTVVYGFLGVIVLLPFIQNIAGGSGMSLFSASLVLSFVVMPTMLLLFYDSLKSIPKDYKQRVLALGGSIEEYQIRVALPFRKKSIIAGVILGYSRAIGDTLIALMLSGNSIQLPSSIFDSGRTLTAHIALLFGGEFDSMEFKSIFLSGLILFFIALFLLIVTKNIRA